MGKPTASALRQNIYRVLDEVAETGKSVDVIRKGRVLRIAAVGKPMSTRSKLGRLPIRPDAFTGDLGDLVDLDWSGYWRP